MKIKVGGYYQTKDNRRAFVEGLDENETQHFFIGFIEGGLQCLLFGHKKVSVCQWDIQSMI